LLLISSQVRKSRAFLLCSLAVLGIVTTQILYNQSIHRGEGSAPTRLLDSETLGIRLAATPALAPMIQGWGGVSLYEAGNGELQATLQRLNQSGYNAVRIGFGGGTSIGCSSGELGAWDPARFTQAIQMARQYSMWVVLDYHSYNDLTDSSCQMEWLAFWSGVLSTNWNYDKIIWEPINEPAGSVALLSTEYQAWITQARSLGDTHWIVIENSWSNGSNPSCTFDVSALVACYSLCDRPVE